MEHIDHASGSEEGGMPANPNHSSRQDGKGGKNRRERVPKKDKKGSAEPKADKGKDGSKDKAGDEKPTQYLKDIDLTSHRDFKTLAKEIHETLDGYKSKAPSALHPSFVNFVEKQLAKGKTIRKELL